MGIAGSRLTSFALFAAVAMLLPTRSHAYTPEQQQACTPDAFRLCGSAIPDVDRVTACMIANKAQLSPPCRAFFRAGPEPTEVVDRPMRRPVSAHTRAKPRKAKKPTRS